MASVSAFSGLLAPIWAVIRPWVSAYPITFSLLYFFIGLHLVFRLCSMKPRVIELKPFIALPSQSDRMRLHFSPKAATDPQVVLVTGGLGLAGRTIVKHLVASSSPKYVVHAVDLFLPKAGAGVSGVTYHASDLSKSSVPSLTKILSDLRVDGVVHTAGLVWMKDDAGSLSNVNILATYKLLHASLLSGSVTAFVQTSSASAINDGTADVIDLHPVGAPYCSRWTSHYSRSKALSEIAVLRANNSDTFKTLALRLPGVYGLNDPWLCGPLARGDFPQKMPGDPNKKVEMVYVENVAAAHVCALSTLLSSSSSSTPCVASGRAYHITNGLADRNRTLDSLLREFLQAFPQSDPAFGPSGVSPQYLPQWLSVSVTCLLEFAYFYCAGRVPFPNDQIWNFTYASLGYMCNDNTFDTSGNDLIGYTPKYSTTESIAHVKGLVEAAKKQQQEQQLQQQQQQQKTTAPQKVATPAPKETQSSSSPKVSAPPKSAVTKANTAAKSPAQPPAPSALQVARETARLSQESRTSELTIKVRGSKSPARAAAAVAAAAPSPAAAPNVQRALSPAPVVVAVAVAKAAPVVDTPSKRGSKRGGKEKVLQEEEEVQVQHPEEEEEEKEKEVSNKRVAKEKATPGKRKATTPAKGASPPKTPKTEEPSAKKVMSALEKAKEEARLALEKRAAEFSASKKGGKQ